MSMESAYAANTAKVQELIEIFTNKNASYDARIATALGLSANTEKTVYLDQVNGNDANSGLTADKAIKTLKQASVMAPAFGGVNIICLSDIINVEPITYFPHGCKIRLVADPKTDGTFFKYKPQITQNPDGTYRIAAIVSAYFGLSITFERIDIELPVNTANVTTQSNVLFYSTASGDSATFFKMYMGNLVSVGRIGYITARSYSITSLYLYQATYNAADMAGRWLANTAPGTDPKTLTDVLTNLATL
ncbi:MAG: hypothetical protein WAS93_07945 [Burkholderiaceae bacterium]